MGFFDRILPGDREGLSRYQAGNVMRLLLGLDQEVPTNPCVCGRHFSKDGAHQLCCKQYAAKGWNRGHDLLVHAIKKETDRLSIPGTDNKQVLSRRYTHAGSGKVADAFIQVEGKITVRDSCQRHQQIHPNFLFDVTVDGMVSTDGVWNGKFDADGKWEDTVLPKAEAEKYHKHEEAYANISLGFLAFALSSYCVLGNDLVRYLWVLARWEAATLSQARTAQGLPAFTPEQLGQLRGRNFSASLARIAHAATKATAMRLTGTPNLPVLHPPRRQQMAWALPGPLDIPPRPDASMAFS